MEQEQEKKSDGALVGLVIIVIILIIGGIYIWMTNKKIIAPVQNPQTETGSIKANDTATLNSIQSDSSTMDTNTGVDANKIN